jgi:hypothetical protein
MNERLKELMLEAGYAAPEIAGRANKLAELIIQECAMFVVIELEGKVGSRIADATANRLEEHFGVKEPRGWLCPKCGIDRAKEACPNGHHAALTGHCPMIGVAQ